MATSPHSLERMPCRKPSKATRLSQTSPERLSKKLALASRPRRALYLTIMLLRSELPELRRGRRRPRRKMREAGTQSPSATAGYLLPSYDSPFWGRALGAPSLRALILRRGGRRAAGGGGPSSRKSCKGGAATPVTFLAKICKRSQGLHHPCLPVTRGSIRRCHCCLC